jgi:hypothetical protein
MGATVSLEGWEDHFQKALQVIDEAKRQKAGALSPAIPNHEKWDEFLGLVKAEWQTWRRNLYSYPHCLVVLYGGLAFYEYDENRFWPQFASAVGREHLPSNQQIEFNDAFAKAAESLGLKIRRRNSSTDYVGSAVYHIGVPLSLWDGFLEICEWALLQDSWKELSPEEWAEATAKRVGSRTRLKNFLLDNRDSARTFIQEMLEARKILIEDQHLTISDLKQMSLLRQEYFDEVLETAEFLRPTNPESLFRDRARLVWDEQRFRISLHLPAVARDKLPATWRVGTREQRAAATPDILNLNSEAFSSWLLLQLESRQRSEPQRIRGIAPWGLFDLERNRFVNLDRQQLPISGYVLISPEKLDDISRKGFDEDEEENLINERYELEDDTTCYVTRLSPTKAAEISFTQQGKVEKLRFRSSAKIEPRFFVGEGRNTAHFTRFEDRLGIEKLPLLCIAVPHSYFTDPVSVLQSKFNVIVDEPQSYRTFGKWEKHHEDDAREFFFWRWADRPIKQRREPRTLHSFKELNAKDFEPPDLTGLRTIFIKAPALGIEFPPYRVEMLVSQPGLEECWKNLPGAFLPWFILCQSPTGMKWDDLLLTRDILAPGQQISFPLLRKYEKYGLLIQQGQTWRIAESRAVLKLSTWECQVQFCGDPSILWGLYRYVSSSISGLKKRTVLRPDTHPPLRTLPSIEVINEQRQLPFLFMRWRSELTEKVKTYLSDHNVRIVSDLWRP